MTKPLSRIKPDQPADPERDALIVPSCDRFGNRSFDQANPGPMLGLDLHSLMRLETAFELWIQDTSWTSPRTLRVFVN
ncbi:MAG: hypothetical protein ABSB41_13415 [Anaerolineales bacterium]